MYVVFSVNYLFFRYITSFFSNDLDLNHKFSSYVNTFIFSLYVVSSIILMTFKNNHYESFYNYIELLDLFRDYFFYDIINMTFFSNFKKNIPFYIHHSLFLFSYFYYYDYLIQLRIHLTKILFCEITQLFLINCWFLHKFTTYRKLLKINGFLLLLTFFIFRIVNFVYHTFISFYILPDSMFYASYLLIILSSLNIYWFYLLTNMFVNV